MSSDDLAQMTREQVRRRERGLSKRVQRIFKEVDAAKADGLGLPWTSRTTGVDMSYEFEHARRWAVLDKEMKRAGADVGAIWVQLGLSIGRWRSIAAGCGRRSH
jgi:hypothetical protein